MDITQITTLNLYGKSERAQIRKDVKGVLAAHGIEVDDHTQYVLAKDTANTFHFVMPDKQRFEELESVNLGQVAAGKKSTFSTLGGCLSTIDPKK